MKTLEHTSEVIRPALISLSTKNAKMDLIRDGIRYKICGGLCTGISEIRLLTSVKSQYLIVCDTDIIEYY